MSLNDAQEKIGYLTGKIEALEADVKENKKTTDEINKKLDKALDQLSLYRHLITFVRGTLLIIAAIVTLKFGDVAHIAKEMFK